MKLFYQLSLTDQDNAVNHCVDLIVYNAIENGLQIESEDDDSKELKGKLDSLFKELVAKDFKTDDEKVSFMMDNESFSSTTFELAHEMANNAFYHEPDELVVYMEVLKEREENSEECADCGHHHEGNEDEKEPVTTPVPKKKSIKLDEAKYIDYICSCL